MTIKTSYTCDRCGRVFDDYDAANACEKSHFVPEWCNNVTWDSLRYVKGEALPGTMILRLEKPDDYNVKAYGLYKLIKVFTEDEARDLEEKAKAKEGEDE